MLTETVRDLTREEYELFREMIYAKSGINLGQEKMQLVRARLGKRLRSGEFRSYRAYYEFVQNDSTGRELCHLIDAISTNTTHLFREVQHFEFLADVLKRGTSDRRWHPTRSEVTIWSAGCSSGEEPHSLAMTVHDALQPHPGISWRMLATDISTRMLDRARQGIYELHRLGTVPERFQRRYFRRVQHNRAACAQVTPELQRHITFARFNLMESRFPFTRGFDFIFCRNVMIYFDRQTQEALVHKFAEHLRPAGYLLIGHSESLNAIEHSLTYVRPTIYQRPGNG
ncbi:MAG: protein-glutamate O-methyltransferase CheR [Planctomycetes bacterium]|nr:protein-glutamate O-methyltransferase CheR [Planctomycetota bacterium]